MKRTKQELRERKGKLFCLLSLLLILLLPLLYYGFIYWIMFDLLNDFS